MCHSITFACNHTFNYYRVRLFLEDFLMTLLMDEYNDEFEELLNPSTEKSITTNCIIFKVTFIEFLNDGLN